MNICGVCDRKGTDLLTLHDFPMHSRCAPKPWLNDEKDRVAFMRTVGDLAPSRLERWRKWK